MEFASESKSRNPQETVRTTFKTAQVKTSKMRTRGHMWIRGRRDRVTAQYSPTPEEKDGTNFGRHQRKPELQVRGRGQERAWLGSCGEGVALSLGCDFPTPGCADSALYQQGHFRGTCGSRTTLPGTTSSWKRRNIMVGVGTRLQDKFISKTWEAAPRPPVPSRETDSVSVTPSPPCSAVTPHQVPDFPLTPNFRNHIFFHGFPPMIKIHRAS